MIIIHPNYLFGFLCILAVWDLGVESPQRQQPSLGGCREAKGSYQTVAVEHQVSHPENRSQRPLNIAGRPALVSVQLRCKIFSHEQSRGKRHKPTPVAVFDIVNAAVVEWLESSRLVFPDLEACKRKLVELTEKIPNASGAGQKRKASAGSTVGTKK